MDCRQQEYPHLKNWTTTLYNNFEIISIRQRESLHHVWLSKRLARRLHSQNAKGHRVHARQVLHWAVKSQNQIKIENSGYANCRCESQGRKRAKTSRTLALKFWIKRRKASQWQRIKYGRGRPRRAVKSGKRTRIPSPKNPWIGEERAWEW